MTNVEMILSAIVAVMGGGGLWSWLSSRGKTKVDLIELGQTIATATIKALQADRAALIAEVHALKAEIAALGVKINAQDDKIETLTTHIEKLETEVRRLGGTPPPRPLPRVKK